MIRNASLTTFSFVAMDGGAVVGTIICGYDGHRGWIYSLAVAPAHRRQGIGSRLVSHAEHALGRRGCTKINLQIMEGNESVAAFYSSLSYCVEKRVSMGKTLPGKYFPHPKKSGGPQNGPDNPSMFRPPSPGVNAGPTTAARKGP